MWLKYQNPPSASAAMFFKQLQNIDNEETERTETKTLRRRKVSKIFGSWGIYQIAIGMDQLYLTSKQTFIKEWWKGDRTYIHPSTNPAVEPAVDDVDWVEVSLPSGQVPFSYPAQGNSKLPSFSATISATQGVV